MKTKKIKFVKNIESFYKHLFSIEEIEKNKILKWAFGAFLLGLFLTFNNWLNNDGFTKEALEAGRLSCWPYFQSCTDWAFFSALPYGYSQTALYMLFAGMMIGIVYLMSLNKWGWAHFLTFLLWGWKTFITFAFFNFTGNYEYYVVIFGFILLALPYKLFFLRFVLVLFYFLSVAVKIHEGWILGTYFSSLKTGLPIFPDWSIPFWTNLVMLLETIGAWFLFAKNKYIQRSILIFYVAFHIYSGILVGYRYPMTVLPMLLIVFGPWYSFSLPPKGWKTLPGWLLIAFLLIGQSWSHFIPGDEKITLEGNFYGLYMFEANHQCVSTLKIDYKDGSVEERVKQRRLARHRCNPYKYWFRSKERQRVNPEIEKIAWTFDHSINGGPFYRIVDEADIQKLEYDPWKRNPWIKLPENAEVMGYPVKNFYR